jgi:hypothetical protein
VFGCVAEHTLPDEEEKDGKTRRERADPITRRAPLP